MNYVSTRGAAGVKSARAILSGIAPDGGLYVPERFPSISLSEVTAMADVPYARRAADVLSRYLSDYPQEALLTACEEGYGPQFSHPEVAPVSRDIGGGTFVLELTHGPTLAFKDMALQVLPRLLTYAARAEGDSREILILVATSGDTGKAALEGFRDVPGTRVAVFYPRDGVSKAQERQMRTQRGANTRVVAVNGNFDDCQTGVKRLFADTAIAREMTARGTALSSANSINWGRLVPQIAYYFSAYADLAARGDIVAGEPINVCVPTGNFGNILAAEYARRMGLPVAHLICASNRNNVLYDFIRTGRYDRRRRFFRTASPSMDILISSNLERLLFELSGRASATVRGWMVSLEQGGVYDIGPDARARLAQTMFAGWCDDQSALKTIASTYSRSRYLLDPHTAVAVHALGGYRAETRDSTKTLVVSTASPYKFASDVLRALGEPVPDEEFACIDLLFDKTGLPVPEPLQELRMLPILHSAACDVSGMAAALL